LSHQVYGARKVEGAVEADAIKEEPHED